MAISQLGTDVTVGAGVDVHGDSLTITNYFVKSIKSGNKDMRSTDVYDGDGVLQCIVVKALHETANLELISKGAARTETNIKADFPVGAPSTVLGTNTWLVTSCEVDKTEDPWVVSVAVRKPGFTLT